MKQTVKIVNVIFLFHFTGGSPFRCNRFIGVPIYYLPLGKYIAYEQNKEGYYPHAPVEFDIVADGYTTINFINDPIVKLLGTLSLDKVVNGENIIIWLNENYSEDEVKAILADMIFDLYKVDGEGADLGEHAGRSDINVSGSIVFNNLESLYSKGSNDIPFEEWLEQKRDEKL